MKFEDTIYAKIITCSFKDHPHTPQTRQLLQFKLCCTFHLTHNFSVTPDKCTTIIHKGILPNVNMISHTL